VSVVTLRPNWSSSTEKTLTEYLGQGWLHLCRLDEAGVWRTLFAAVRVEDARAPYLQAFVQTAKQICFDPLSGIRQADPPG